MSSSNNNSSYPIEFVLIDGVGFLGPYTQDFAASRREIWKNYPPDIRNALTSRNIMPVATQGTYEHYPDFKHGVKSFTKPADNFLLPRTDNNGAYALDAPLPHLTPLRAGLSFHKTIACAIDAIFGCSQQPGFIQARLADVKPAPGYIDKHNQHARGAFMDVWANQAAQAAGTRYNSNMADNFPEMWQWVAANTPSAHQGFDLKSADINKPDLANRTPLENLLWSPKGQAGLSRPELASLLRAGANPFQHNLVTDRSVVDELIARKDHERLYVVIMETTRQSYPKHRVPPRTWQSLQDYAEFELPDDKREAGVKALENLSMIQPFPALESFLKRNSGAPATLKNT